MKVRKFLYPIMIIIVQLNNNHQPHHPQITNMPNKCDVFITQYNFAVTKRVRRISSDNQASLGASKVIIK